MDIQDIFEARDGMLYHTMDIFKANDVFSKDEMEARFRHKIPIFPDRVFMGNSFTRDPYLKWNSDVKIVVDQRMLAQTNKIIPLDGENCFYHKIDSDNERRGKRDVHSRDPSNGYSDLREEFVVGPIKLLHRYIRRIYLMDNRKMGNDLKSLVHLCKYYAEEWQIPLDIDPKVLKAYQEELLNDTYDDE